MIDLSYNKIDNKTAELVSNIIKDGIEEIDLQGCELTNRGITPITEKIVKFKNPVNIFIFYIIVNLNCDIFMEEREFFHS